MGSKAKWHGGDLYFYDSATYERTLPVSALTFYDDFLGAGAAVVPASGSAESGVPWVKGITGAAPPTVGISANALNGVMELALTADSQAQTAALYWGDSLGLNPALGLNFECRAKLSVLPTLVAEIQFGLAGAYNAAPDTTALSMFFDADGSGAINCATDDNVVDSGAISSGVTCLATDWKVYRIDCTDVTDIKFYIDGAEVCGSTTFAWTDVTALQPTFQCYKASGAGLGTLLVDYVRCWQKRA